MVIYAAFSVLAFVLLFLLYFAIRSQKLERELKANRQTLKANSKQLRSSMKALLVLADEMQQVYMHRFNSAYHKGLLSQDNHIVGSVLLANLAFVIIQCCEYRNTVEQAVTKAISSAGLPIGQVNNFIALQPNKVKLAWSQNSLDGFLQACRLISISELEPHVTDQSVQTATL